MSIRLRITRAAVSVLTMMPMPTMAGIILAPTLIVIVTFPIAFPVPVTVIPFLAAVACLVSSGGIAALVLSRLPFVLTWPAAAVVVVFLTVAFPGRGAISLLTFIPPGHATSIGAWFIAVAACAAVVVVFLTVAFPGRGAISLLTFIPPGHA